MDINHSYSSQNSGGNVRLGPVLYCVRASVRVLRSQNHNRILKKRERRWYFHGTVLLVEKRSKGYHIV